MVDDRRQPPDSTAPMPRRDFDDPEATRTGDADATRVGPPAGPSTRPPADPRWAASASVPPPTAAQVGQYYEQYDPEPAPIAPDEPETPWLRPVALGLLGLVLLGVLLTGVWLIFTADDEPAPTATPGPSGVATSSAPAASRAPATSAAATSEPPPQTVAPETVLVPNNLVGLSEAEAKAKLAEVGLRAQVEQRPDSTMAPGTVLETGPRSGVEVKANSVVRLVVAVKPEPPKPSDDDDGNG